LAAHHCSLEDALTLKLLLASTAALVALPVQAALPVQGTPSVQDAGPKAEEDPDERICRAITPATGSRLSARRTCATRAQWHAVEVNRAFARRGIEQIQVQRVCRANDCR
jgi:hypothetical protein